MDSGLTILGGKGFVGGAYVDKFYDQAVGNIAHVNERQDYNVYSKDVLYFISTTDNCNVRELPHIDIDTNLNTLITVLENWRQRSDAKHGVFNFISSWFVYGDSGNGEWTNENSRCYPSGFYSITKHCAEQLLRSYCAEYNLKYRIIRLGNIVGPGDKKVSYKKNTLQYLLNRLALGESVHISGRGDMRRDYVHVSDCVNAIDLILNKGELCTVYNVGNGPTWNLENILDFCYTKLNSISRVTYGRAPEQRFFFDNGKLVELGYVPKFTEAKLFNALCEVALENAHSHSECAR